MKFNRFTKSAVATTGAVAFALSMAATQVAAEDEHGAKEKCYGVAAKGKNDCGTGHHSCAGQSKVDHAPDEWLYVPAGLCERIAGGTTHKPE